jgi:hypothetical protein
MAYLLDANVFIEAKNRHYSFDFCPAFWSWLEREHASRKVFSIPKVAEELARGADDLARWAAELSPGFFLSTGPAELIQFAKVANWVSSSGRDPGAIARFLSGADAYLVAHALATGWRVVTHELASTSLKKVKVPDVCSALGVQVMSPFAMLRQERARFELGASVA